MRIILFREDEDAYREALGTFCDRIDFIPVIECQECQFDPAVLSPHSETTCIVTSAHAARVLARHATHELQVYVVGPATRKALGDVAQTQPFDIETSCSAQGLIENVKRLGTRRRVVYMRGDRALDTIPDALKALEIDYTAVIVYTTRAKSNLHELLPLDLRNNLLEILSGKEKNVAEIAARHRDKTIYCFFSPSGVESVASALGLSAAPTSETTIQLVAIGNTTARAISTKFGVKPLVASSPTPVGVAEIIGALQ